MVGSRDNVVISTRTGVSRWRQDMERGREIGGRETLLSQNLESIKNVCSLLLEETEQLETAKDDASVRELRYA